MYVRLAFAVAAHLEPEILLVDEVLAVGDAEFQRSASARWRTSATAAARCSSSPTTCRRSPALPPRDPPREGEVVVDGPSAEVVAHYLQPGSGSGSERAVARSATLRPTSSCDCVRRGCSRRRALTGTSRCAHSGGHRDHVHGAGRGRARCSRRSRSTIRQGDVAFNAIDTSPRWREPSPALGTTPPLRGSREPAERGARSGSMSRCAPIGTTKFHPHARGERCRLVPCPGSGRGRLGARRLSPGRCAASTLLEWRTRSGEAGLVGISLVRNEDIFLEQAIPECAGFLRPAFTGSITSLTDGTWEVLRTLARDYDHLDVRRVHHAGDSHKLVEQYAGTDTWVFGVDGDELYDPVRLSGLRTIPRRGLRRCLQDRLQHAQLRRDRSGSADGFRLSLAAFAPGEEAVQLRRNRVVGRRRSGATHGGTIVYRPGYDERSVDNIGDRLSWDETPLRCLHATFMRRSSGDP